jgi:uncharacterized protein YndB with AHSA1/START domain
MAKTMTEQRRAFEMSLDLDATVDDVWRALTDAEELIRWFPLEARVTPGEGGTMLWSWGDTGEWETRIDGWEPGRLLRLVQDEARPFDAEGRPLPPGQAEPARLAMEFTLETRQGKTRLRLVHSGFGHGTAWDNEFEGISEGWQAELRSLRHYLGGFRGRDRIFARAWLTTAVARDEAWARLVGRDGFRLQPPAVREGEAYEVTSAAGHHLTGTVELHLPGQTMLGTVRELGGGLFRLLTWTDPTGRTGVWASLASYEGSAEPVHEFAERTQPLLERLFPREAE